MMFATARCVFSWNILTVAFGHILVLITELKLIYNFPHLLSNAKMIAMSFHTLMSIIFFCAFPEVLWPFGDKVVPADIEEVKSIA